MSDNDDFLKHYGMPRRSGRYPWGSGENPYQNSKNFLSYVDDLRKQGLTDKEIADGLDVKLKDLKLDLTIANNQVRAADQAQAVHLKYDKQYSNVAIAARMGVGESQVRSLLKQAADGKVNQLQNTADKMKDQLEKGDYIDIGEGTHFHMGVSKNTKDAAVAMLEDQGYKKHYVKAPQLGTEHETTLVILAKEQDFRTVNANRENIKLMNHVSEDRGRTSLGLKDPTSVSSDRIQVRYAEEGGDQADGTIYVRPGKDDLSLGNSQYAQVRIAVDGTHYLKGVAIPKDGLPQGVDLVFNTNKSDTGNKLDAMKPMKKDPSTGKVDKDNPFGSSITRQEGAMNIVNEEGEWDDWSRNLSSQMLSKQPISLVKQQLNVALENKRAEFDQINSLTNPTVKKHLLSKFADGADASAVSLKAAALPRQNNRVLIPIESMRDNEVYSPSHRNGETVALVRHPHGGIFEIPELKVNNRHREARQMLGDNPADAIGINSRVAQRLSGADFDGDTVLVIPNDSGAVKSSPSLQQLKDFDPQRSYAGFDGMRTIDGGTLNAKTGDVTYGPKGPAPNNAQRAMGEVSNLITDMTIKGASQSEIARAVKHSMVVIDAEKHKLNHKQSETDNGIPQLKRTYQSDPNNPGKAGASTLVSRASSTIRVPERQPRRASEGGPINPDGSQAWTPTERGFTDANGQWVPRQTKTTRMAEARDARELSSGLPVDEAYAEHANNLKSLANEARLGVQQTKPTPYSPSAREAYRPQVESLRSSLNTALENAPRERQAQILGNAVVEAKQRANPHMTKEEVKKLKGQAIQEARERTQAKKTRVSISDDEWEAIQSGAVSPTMLESILNNADLDKVKERATPRSNYGMTPSMEARARSMLSAGYTQAEVADALGVAPSTIGAL